MFDCRTELFEGLVDMTAKSRGSRAAASLISMSLHLRFLLCNHTDGYSVLRSFQTTSLYRM